MTDIPRLPPLLTGWKAAAQEHAFDAAVSGAGQGRFSAGDLVWRVDTLFAEAAVVLEPAMPPAQAAAVMLVAAVAAGDSLAALLPPERPISFAWPDRVHADGGEIGRVRMLCGPVESDATPQWMVVALTVRLAHDGTDPGDMPDLTSLEEEGAGDVGGVRLIEAFSRHFVFRMHLWDTEGLGSIARDWARLADGPGRFLGIDDDGNAMVADEDEVRTLKLLDAMGRIDA